MQKKAFFIGNSGITLYHFRLPLMKYLMSKGWVVTAVANNEADYDIRFKKEGIRFINVFIDHKGKNPFKDLYTIVKLKNIFLVEKPDFVHFFSIKPVIFGSIAAKWAKVQAIINTITGLGYVFEKGGIVMEVVKILYKISLAGRPQVILLNRDNMNLFFSKKIVKRDQANLIFGEGVDTITILPKNKSSSKNTIQFIMVARMLWSKGVREYVEAAEFVKQKYSGTSFIMVGGASAGKAKPNPEAIPIGWLNNVNKRGYVNWLGQVSFNKIIRLMEESDVAILTSYHEGLPNSLTEAAAKGLPIITTNTSGCNKVVKNNVNGFLVPIKNVEQLIKSMEKFIQQPNLITKMGHESRKRAEELFDTHVIIDKILSVYRKTGIEIS